MLLDISDDDEIPAKFSCRVRALEAGAQPKSFRLPYAGTSRVTWVMLFMDGKHHITAGLARSLRVCLVPCRDLASGLTRSLLAGG